MSSKTPYGPNGDPAGEPVHGSVGGSSGAGPEYLGSGVPSDAGERSSRRWPVLGATAVGVAAALGLGGWGAFALLSGGGAQPAEALPGRTVAYVSLDLDPSASQKIEAIKILKKFPGLAKELDVSTTDDLRRLVFEKIQDEGECTGVDYDTQVEPWIGERVALAAVPDDKPGVDAPVLALQVTDQEAATEGVQALAACSGAGDDFGYAFSGDYLLVTDSEKRADAVVADAAEASLADSATFQDWTDKVGDPGIVTMYAGPGAPAFLGDLQQDLSQGWMSYATEGQMPGGVDAEIDPELLAESERTAEQLQSLYKDFEGMAAVVRFTDGAVEAEFATAGMPTGTLPDTGTVGPNITELPDSTAGAFSMALADGWLTSYLESMAGVMGGGESVEELLEQAERDTGLTLPEDIETLLGDGVSLTFDSGADLEAVFESEDLSALPIGLRVSGEPAEIMPVVDKVRTAIGPDGDMLLAEPGDDVVAFGLNPDYVETLLTDGDLGDDETFRRAVPEADRANGVLYVNFDANGWSEAAADLVSEMEAGLTGETSDAARRNVAPLDALGISSWVDDGVHRGLFRLTTD